jgi:hypothetical protein
MLSVCATGIALVAYLASTVLRDVYSGIPSSLAVSAIEATCQPTAAATACVVDYQRLNQGRFLLRTRGPASSVTIVPGGRAPIAGARVLLVRTEEVGRLTIDSDQSGPGTAAITREISEARTRTVISLPQPPQTWNRITFAPASSGGAVIVRELGFFATDRDLLRSSRQPMQSISGVRFYSTVAAMLTLAVCALVVIAAWMAPRAMYGPMPWLMALLCVSVCILEIGTIFSPYWSFDLRSFYGEELTVSPIGGNLVGGLSEGSRLVQGLGQTIGPGFVQWHRMPGYGWLCALAAVIGRTTDMVEIAMIVVVLQVLLYSAAVGLFVVVGRRVVGLPIATLIGVLIALLPKQVSQTEVD